MSDKDKKTDDWKQDYNFHCEPDKPEKPEQTVPSESSVSNSDSAFEEWRGPDLSRDYMHSVDWIRDTGKLKEAWNAGRDFERSVQKQNENCDSEERSER